ncbi:hypothetical protein ACSNM8_28060, partial [Klebsiella pneumoniae]
QNDVTLKMPAFEWVHVQLHQQKGMISLSPPTICNSATLAVVSKRRPFLHRFNMVLSHCHPQLFFLNSTIVFIRSS